MTQLAKKSDLKGLLESESVKNRINEILGKNAPAFITSVIQISSQNVMLAKCEAASIVGAAMTAATLNLPVNNSLGFSYIIPYGTKAQFQIGYRGFVRLAQRSGQFLRINAGVVIEGEIVKIDRLTGDMTFNWTQNEQEREGKKPVGYFAYFKLTNGYEHTLYMTIEELRNHAKKFSKTFKTGGGLWQSEFDAMAQKTVLKMLLSKYAPLSVDMEQAVQKDQAAFNDIDDAEDISYVDNEYQEPEVDHEFERQADVMKSLSTREDFEFANGVVTHEDLVKELHIKIVESVSDEEGIIWAETIVTDEVAKANLKLKSVQIKKASKK